MTQEQITARIALLFLSLQFDTEERKMFTVGERIMINQERFQWMHILTYPHAQPRPVSNIIEAKIQTINSLIGVYDFKPLNQTPFQDESQ